MSGTSADGLDVAICQIQDQHNINFIAGYSFAYPSNLQDETLALQLSSTADNIQSDTISKAIKTLDQDIADFVIRACQSSIEQSGIQRDIKLDIEHKVKHSEITAIANHGQTILHQPNASPPFSLQIGNAQAIAKALNIPVISDFRTADIEAGGQGAPLIPAFHQAMFQQHAPCNIINIGGIANITSLDSSSSNKATEKIIGFDTGPGNTLLDQWYKQHHQHGSFDRNGDWARSGQCNQALLNEWLKEPYFTADYPKSTGQDLFNLNWLEQGIQRLAAPQQLAANDVQHTLSQLTAHSIKLAVEQLQKTTLPIYLCGGGVHNTLLVEHIQAALPQAKINSTASIGIDPNWVEAMGFAWLGYCRLHNIAANSPTVTGAKQAVVLGSISSPLAG